MEISQLPGYRLQEYILMIGLPEELTLQVKQIKKQFAAAYEAVQAESQPYILLSSFSAISLMEDRVVQKLENICRSVTPFKIELSDFGAFPSHTIYINVTSKMPVKSLVKSIKQAQQLLKPDKDHKPYFIDEAHVAICKKLKPWQFEKAWLEYSNLEYTGRFIASKAVLLRKRDDGFDKVGSFKFSGLEEKVSQGNLFNS